MRNEKKISERKVKNTSLATPATPATPANFVNRATQWLRLAVMASVVVASQEAAGECYSDACCPGDTVMQVCRPTPPNCSARVCNGGGNPSGNGTVLSGTGPCSYHPGIPGPDETSACTGNFETLVPLVNTDLVLHYHSVPSLLDRYYSLRSVSADYLGKQWRFLNDASLFFNSDVSEATVVLGDGTGLVYRRASDGKYWPIDPRTTQSYIELINGTPKRIMKDRTQQAFGFRDSAGVYHLTVQWDPNGKQRLNLSRSDLGKITSISGYRFRGASSISYSSNGVTVPNQINQNLSLNLSQGNLTKVNFPPLAGSSAVYHSFIYSGVGGNLSEHRYPAGKKTTVTYYPDGAVKRIVHAGFSTSFIYDVASVEVKTLHGNQKHDFVGGKLSAINNRESGESMTLARDTFGRIVAQTVNGLTTQFTYGLSTNDYARTDFPTQVISPGQVTTTIGYANRSQQEGGLWTLPTTVTTAGPRGSKTSVMTYDNLNRLTKLTQGTAKTIFEYFGNTENPTKISVNNNSVFAASYNAQGELASVTDARGVTTTVNFNNGWLSEARNPYGFVGPITRDSIGRPTHVPHSEGSESYQYDSIGNTQRVDSINHAGDAQWATKQVRFTEEN